MSQIGLKTGWVKRRGTFWSLIYSRIPFRVKSKFYKTVVKPTIMYESKYWVVKKQYSQNIGLAKTGMLKWMPVITRKDRLRLNLSKINWK